MDIHNNDNDNDHRVDLQSRRRYTNMISRFCNLLAQQPSHRHMIRHDSNGDLVLIYNRLDVVAVKTYTEHLRRRLGRYPHWSTVMKLHDAIRWGSRLANESLSSTYRVGLQQYIRQSGFLHTHSQRFNGETTSLAIKLGWFDIVVD